MVLVHYLDKQGVSQTIGMSREDRDRLFQLMQKLFAQDSFAYTVFGSKPVSWETFQSPFPLSSWAVFLNSFGAHSRTLRSGWETWQKYQHLFPLANIWSESPKCRPGYTSILIVNEDLFNEVVNSNKRDFEKVLRRKIVDGVGLLREAESQSLMNDVLEGHQGLMGIVLGYGRDNSWKFLECCTTRIPVGCVWADDDDPMPEFVDSDMTFTDYCLLVYSCPSFAGDPNSAESLALKEKYLSTKQEIINYYKGKDFLEATLSLLAGYRPVWKNAENASSGGDKE